MEQGPAREVAPAIYCVTTIPGVVGGLPSYSVLLTGHENCSKALGPASPPFSLILSNDKQSVLGRRRLNESYQVRNTSKP